jgi:VanZ family protein
MPSSRPDEARERRDETSLVARWTPVVLWMLVVFFFSSLPRLGSLGLVPDWISHPVEYGVGAALVCRALSGGRRPIAARTALAAVLLVTGYGVTDEYHQSFVPGRDADPLDVAKDLAGATVASVLYRRYAGAPAASARGGRGMAGESAR